MTTPHAASPAADDQPDFTLPPMLAENPELRSLHAAHVLGLGDTCLILGHRLSEWCAHAPSLETDIALSNLALDLIGQARLLLTHAGRLRGAGEGEDDLAYFRDQGAFRNALLVEQPNGDFARTIARSFLHDRVRVVHWAHLSRSSDPILAGIAEKAEKEARYHARLSADWVIRLGDGTEESRRRMIAALLTLWPYRAELLELLPGEEALVAAGLIPDPAAIRPRVEAETDAVLAEARLDRPVSAYDQTGGRSGRHTEHLGRILSEMQSLARAHPGATW